MDETTKKEIQTLKRQVAELMRFMESKKKQQISFPVDETSKKLLRDITA